MKVPVTWILRANSGAASIVEFKGRMKGFSNLPGMSWTAAPPVEYSDRAGSVRAGDSYEKTNPKDLAEDSFARQIAEELNTAAQSNTFERFILCAAPHMLGTLRPLLSENVRKTVMAEIPKDLTQVPLDRLSEHLKTVFAV